MAFALAVGDVVVLLSFSAQARGVRLYEVDCHRLVIGSPVVVRRNPNRYDRNAVDLLIPHRFSRELLFLGHGTGSGYSSFSPPFARFYDFFVSLVRYVTINRDNVGSHVHTFCVVGP